MKDKVTTQVDHELHEMIEKTKGVHGMTLGEVFELGIRTVLMQMNETHIIEQELNRMAIDISNRLQKEKELRSLHESISKLRVPVIETKSNGNEAEELEAYRNKRFQEAHAGNKAQSTEERLASTKKLLINGGMNWERIIEVYKFKNKDEARTWMERKVLVSEV